MEFSWWWSLLVAFVLIYILCNISPTLKYYIKYTFLCIHYIVLAICIGVFGIFRPGSSRQLYIPQFFSRVMAFRWLYGFDIVTVDWHNVVHTEKPVVIVSNHQTILDAFVMMSKSPNGTVPVAKKSILFVPIFGIVCWLYGTIFINRSKLSKAIKKMTKASIRMREEKTSVWIFPEGTRYQNNKIGPFKKGAFHLAVQAQVPIVPVVLENCRHVIDVPNKRFEGGMIRVKALKPVSTEGLSSDDVDDLMRDVHQRMSNCFYEDLKDHQD